MDYIIRNMREDEWHLLEEFLFQAIYVPEGFEGEVSRDIVRDDPKCRAAYEGFGSLPDDQAMVAVVDGEVVGACWVRTTDEYGHTLFEEFRGRGIGTELMQRMLDDLLRVGYARTSLSVQKENPAARLYARLGFRSVGNGVDETEWLMIRELNEPFTLIETSRLILRPWLASDAESLFSLASDSEIGPAAGWLPHESVEESAKIIETVFAAPETYAVVLKEGGALVGCVGFNAGDAASMSLSDGELELGYWIGRPYWGRGYAVEAARALVERGFVELGLHGIHAAYFDGNERSRRVLDRLGFFFMRTEKDVECVLLGEKRTEHFMCLSR